MGTYFRVHMGCYLKVPVTNKPVTKTYFEKPSGKRAKSRFNSETGEEYQQKSEIVNEKVYPSAYIEDRPELHCDAFWSPPYAGVDPEKYRVFLPNATEDNLLNGDTSYDFCIPLNDIDPACDMAIKFKRKYRKYIDYYKEKYPTLEINFGVVRYGS